jgi:chemotaxis protein methyltransferase CheR
MEMSPLALTRLSGLLERHTGQQIGAGRRWRLATSLRPVIVRFGLDSLDALALRVGEPERAGAGVIIQAVVEALLNHETSFFRDRATFTLLAEQILPGLAAARDTERRLRLWSAGCATGQELHSLAMMVEDAGSAWAGWQMELLGTDVSAAATGSARLARYSQFEVQRGLGIAELLRHFDQEGDQWRVKRTVSHRCRFAVHNLLDPPPGRFDLVLCRNVMLYFPPAARAQAFARLEAALAPDGVLILGAGETVLGQTDAFRPDPRWRGCYRRTSVPPIARAAREAMPGRA